MREQEAAQVLHLLEASGLKAHAVRGGHDVADVEAIGALRLKQPGLALEAHENSKVLSNNLLDPDAGVHSAAHHA